MAKKKVTIEQGTVLDLSREVKKQLQDKSQKETRKEVNALRREKKQIITQNRKLGWAKRRVKKEIYKKGQTKVEIKTNLTKLKNLEEQYQDPAILQNEINMKSGKDFYYLVDLGDSAKIQETWGKKRNIFKIGSKQFQKRTPGEIELTLLRRWKRSLQKGIEEEENEKIRKGLEKLLSPIEKNIQVLTGEIEEEDVEAEIKKEDYPIFTDITGENISIFLSGTRR